jgi:hypothetical protein
MVDETRTTADSHHGRVSTAIKINMSIIIRLM